MLWRATALDIIVNLCLRTIKQNALKLKDFRGHSRFSCTYCKKNQGFLEVERNHWKTLNVCFFVGLFCCTLWIRFIAITDVCREIKRITVNINLYFNTLTANIPKMKWNRSFPKWVIKFNYKYNLIGNIK